MRRPPVGSGRPEPRVRPPLGGGHHAQADQHQGRHGGRLLDGHRAVTAPENISCANILLRCILTLDTSSWQEPLPQAFS